MSKRRPKRSKVKHSFESESHLCASFMLFAKERGWRVFPETGCDILLVATKDTQGADDIVEGDTVCIEAKLKPNLDVIYQARPRWLKSTGPAFHAILLPEQPPMKYIELCNALRIDVLYPDKTRGWDRLPLWHRHYYDGRPWYPKIAIDVELTAGAPRPRKLSKWKITAIRLCLVGEERGYVTRRDFMEFGLSMDRWFDKGWLKSTYDIEPETRLKKYLLTDIAPHRKNPEVVEAVRLTHFPKEQHEPRKRRRGLHRM